MMIINGNLGLKRERGLDLRLGASSLSQKASRRKNKERTELISVSAKRHRNAHQFPFRHDEGGTHSCGIVA